MHIRYVLVGCPHLFFCDKPRTNVTVVLSSTQDSLLRSTSANTKTTDSLMFIYLTICSHIFSTRLFIFTQPAAGKKDFGFLNTSQMPICIQSVPGGYLQPGLRLQPITLSKEDRP